MPVTLGVLLFTTRRTALTSLGALSLATLLSGCSGGDHSSMDMSGQRAPSATGSSTAVASGPHNAADVTFATDMIPHHEQAVEMADLALDKASDAEVRKLARSIADAQTPEIATMSGWLTAWGEPVPSGMAGHSMSTGSTMGMMTEAQMTELENASGTAFDRLWLTMMTEHHEGAITMAETQLTAGQYEGAKSLAQQIIQAQTREITTMAAVLKRLPRS